MSPRGVDRKVSVLTVGGLGARDLAGCEHRTALDSSSSEVAATLPHTASAVRRMEAAALHRAQVRQTLRGFHRDSWIDISETGLQSHADRVEMTMRAISSGTRWIWSPALPDDPSGAHGSPEALVATPEGHVPVIVVNHRVSHAAPDRSRVAAVTSETVTSPLWAWMPGRDPARSARPHRRDQLRLAHLRRILISAGVRTPWTGASIGLDADSVIITDLAPIWQGYLATFNRRRDIAAGREPTRPSRVGECRGCRWWPVSCEPRLLVDHDVSLVVNGQQATALRSHGVTSVDQLARASSAPDEWAGAPFDDAVVVARAWLADVPIVRRVPRPTIHRADVEVDVDMESHGEDGAYLWGTLLTDNTDPSVPVRYRPFASWSPLPTDDEARSFAEFWAWLSARRAEAAEAGKTFAAYCYSQSAENRWLRSSARRFAGFDGVPTLAEIDEFIDSDQWQDVFEAVADGFICPHGRGLKTIAPLAGFTWRDPEAGGEASMEWYRRAVGIGGRADIGQRTRLLQYNEDDVRATKVLREWIDQRAADEVPTIDELPLAGSAAQDDRRR